MSSLLRQDEPNPYDRANSLSDLLWWEDADFVRCAYVTLLGRQPDPSGERHYTRLIRRGVSKLEILSRLRGSPEARQHDPGIAGLDRALRRARRQRVPLIGGLFRMFATDPDHGSEPARRHRARLNASTLERYALHVIGLKLGGIEWLVEQQGHNHTLDHQGRGGAQTQVDEIETAERPAQRMMSPNLKHLRSPSPLVRFFQEEWAR